jgi:diguanylate cyclase (GGDEF)-like protein
MSRGEKVVHELVRILAETQDRETILRSFLRAAGSITEAQSVEWYPEATEDGAVGFRPDPTRDEPRMSQPGNLAGSEGSHGAEPGTIELGIGASSRIEGWVRLVGCRSAASRSPRTAARLNTLAILAASALRGTDRGSKRESESGRGHADSTACCAEPIRSFDPDEGSREHDSGHVPILQDATFLNAVLPFALGLARRHRESLALLCIAVDRLGGIRELMGKESANQAVDTVGREVAAMIRSSDIVARIDDDRIIAVLPRAPMCHARRVAESICRKVETLSSRPCALPGLTLSIGVAEYPTCAETLYAVLDAADHALAEAQRTGRNRVVSAHPQTASDRGEVAMAYQSVTEPSSLS